MQTPIYTIRRLCFVLLHLWTILLAEPSPYMAEEGGPHHIVWKGVTPLPGPGGKEYWITNTYVELASGLNVRRQGRWQPAQPVIEIFQGSAVARQTQHQVLFAANLNTAGAIDLQAPDGKRLRSHVLALAYTDDGTGQRVLLATVSDCDGAVLPPNQVLYLDAFRGECRADVRYTHTRSGLEQDIILRQAPPAPEAWGLDPNTTCLEIITEFLSPPPPGIKPVRNIPETPGRQGRRESPVRRRPDVHLDFGTMQIGSGRAFLLQDEEAFASPGRTMRKRWERIEGRYFLLEQIPYPTIQDWLGKLPQSARRMGNDRTLPLLEGPAEGFAGNPFPPPPTGPVKKWPDQRWAQASGPAPGLVLDYLISNQSLSNFTFRGDTTYLISGRVSLSGTTVIEGGTVVKYGAANSPQLEFRGPVDCRTAPWHPAVFTAKDDDTIGDIISGSTGQPEGAYALYALACRDPDADYQWHDLRIRYARYGLAMYDGTRGRLRHSQIGPVECAVAWQTDHQLWLGNVLLHDARYAFGGFSPGPAVEHGTLHRIGSLLRFPRYTMALTNSLLVGVTNHAGLSGSHVAVFPEGAGIFQEAAAGAHYLAGHSDLHDAGTPHSDAALQRDLTDRTTDPPVLLANPPAKTVVLSPQARRDVDRPDLGYHYDPLDFVLTGLSLSEATLLVTNGAAVGVSGEWAGFGLQLLSGAVLLSQGEADKPNRFVDLRAVQEGPFLAHATEPLFREAAAGGLPAQVRFYFTDFLLLSGAFLWQAGFNSGNVLQWEQQHCRVRSGRLAWAFTFGGATLLWKNNLWDSVDSVWILSPAINGFLYNNLFYKGQLRFEEISETLVVQDNVFDQIALSLRPARTFTHDYNGYVAGHPRLLPPGPHDVLLPAPLEYGIGPFGRYYYAAGDPQYGPLIDGGSRSAAEAGLYHFTTTSPPGKEGNSRVDIGFHHVAGAPDHPVDTDEDGLPDYQEDRNGNGWAELGETHFQLSDTDGDGMEDYREWLQGRCPILGGAMEDPSGAVMLEVFTPLE